MKNKKSPERFSIRFDSTIPEHQRVIEILAGKGRNAARYIADAVIAYENRNKNSLESTVTEVVNKILGLNAVKSNAPSILTRTMHSTSTISQIILPALKINFLPQNPSHILNN